MQMIVSIYKRSCSAHSYRITGRFRESSFCNITKRAHAGMQPGLAEEVCHGVINSLTKIIKSEKIFSLVRLSRMDKIKGFQCIVLFVNKVQIHLVKTYKEMKLKHTKVL